MKELNRFIFITPVTFIRSLKFKTVSFIWQRLRVSCFPHVAFSDNPHFIPFEAPALVKMESFFFLIEKIFKMSHMFPSLLKQIFVKRNLASSGFLRMHGEAWWWKNSRIRQMGSYETLTLPCWSWDLEQFQISGCCHVPIHRDGWNSETCREAEWPATYCKCLMWYWGNINHF